MTREVVWTGHDRAFVEAMIAELGILLDVESATVSIIRMHSVQMYTIDDGAIEISLTAGPNRIEVRRTVIGIRGETVVNLSEVRANRARLQCHALVDRIQVRELNATPASDDPDQVRLVNRRRHGTSRTVALCAMMAGSASSIPIAAGHTTIAEGQENPARCSRQSSACRVSREARQSRPSHFRASASLYTTVNTSRWFILTAVQCIAAFVSGFGRLHAGCDAEIRR